MRALHRLLVAALALPIAAFAFDFADVDKRAAELAKKPYEAPKNDLPSSLRNLTYDQYRDIRFRNDKSLWRADKLPFEVAFFHRGGQFVEAVRIHEVIPGAATREIAYTGERFDYGANAIDRTKIGNIGFAGFRVHFNINTPKYKDEVLVFLGASYFRALGKEQRYGLSARGLAIDTGLASGEEFPRFVEFWLERPEPNAKELVIYGLLDSKSMAGAYRFVLKPGTDTVVAVKARLHARRNVAKLGIAPLTSMYLYGENQRAPGEDYRPEVHDSDGLSIQLGTGEWVWRPLVNPKRLLVTSFGATNPLGFGLQQRDRSFASYEDLEARYELRPGAWIKPTRPFGPGRVELVQIPSQFEYNDNMVAYWIPREPTLAGKALDFEYQLLWQKNNPTRSPTSWVAQTRRGPGFVRSANDTTIDFHVDFEGPALRKLPEKAKLDAIFTADANGEIVEQALQRNPVTEGARVSLRVKRLDPAKPIELRGFLRDESENHSETWSYIVPPE
ncbi:glucan biosynthesis protein G [Betaproteobacteria bacterium GR16-43]|nr:glucan biosynthesis protein G [Betaproteobacteria bacterium GR16-43]